MANGIANTVHAPAMGRQRRCDMSKQQAILHYRAAVSVFQKWLKQGIINEGEFVKIDALIADKYGLPKGSIYR